MLEVIDQICSSLRLALIISKQHCQRLRNLKLVKISISMSVASLQFSAGISEL